MSKKRLCGYDVNGVRDLVARNWMLRPGEEETFVDCVIGKGDLFGSVVQVGTKASKEWIGGRQAALAPHGKGGGWGAVGASERRQSILNLLAGRVETEDSADALGCAFTGLAFGARYNAVAIDEVSDDAELYQERILAALAKKRIANPMLVWRSILAVLYHLTKTQVPEKTVIGVISHGLDGLRLQRLRILKRAGRSSDIYAPERRQVAQNVPFTLDYLRLVQSARERLLKGDPLSDRNAHLMQARSVGALALGVDARSEVLRDKSGQWHILPDQDPLELDVPDISGEDLAALSGCDVVLFESLAQGGVRDVVAGACEKALSCPLLRLPVEAVAIGALEAARRMADGDPVFFDFLPKISTIVYSGDKAENFDLIDDSETLEAGRLYRSPKPAQLGLPGGQSEVSVYLRKEGQLWPRKAHVNVGKPLDADAPVSLFVEQRPAAGRARILMDAASIGRQFSVDWDQAEEIESDWDALIAEQNVFKPSIPNKLILPCAHFAWEENNQSPSLYDLLDENVDRVEVDWAALARKLVSRPQQTYCISSEGELPPEVDAAARAKLDRLTERALEETRERLSGRREDNNESLKFLTWQFKRAPDEVVDHLLACIAGRDIEMFSHPFIRAKKSWMLVYYGAGRIISDPGREKKLMDIIFTRHFKSWRWDVEAPALAVMLSRSDTAPQFLSPERVDIVAAYLKRELKASLRGTYTKFSYLPFLLVGLLRYRLVEGTALVRGHDPRANALAQTVEAVLEDLNARAPRDDKIRRVAELRRDQLIQILEEIEGKGTQPDLLLNLFHTT